MGNCECAGDSLFQDLSAWQAIQKHQNYELIMNLHDQKTLMQKWYSSSIQQRTLYSRRNDNDVTWFPTLYNFGQTPLQRNYIRAKSYVITNVLVPLRQLPFLSVSQALLLSLSVLQGMRLLFNRFGKFHISSDMIWVDQSGTPKVWMHSNLAENQPKCPALASFLITEEQLVEQALKIIVAKTTPDQVFPLKSLKYSFQTGICQLRHSLAQIQKPTDKISVKKMRQLIPQHDNRLSKTKSIENISFVSSHRATLDNSKSAQSLLHQVKEPSSINKASGEKTIFTAIKPESASSKLKTQYSSNRDWQFQNGLVSAKTRLSIKSIQSPRQNELQMPFKMIERQASNKDPDQMLAQLMKEQNIRFD